MILSFLLLGGLPYTIASKVTAKLSDGLQIGGYFLVVDALYPILDTRIIVRLFVCLFVRPPSRSGDPPEF